MFNLFKRSNHQLTIKLIRRVNVWLLVIILLSLILYRHKKTCIDNNLFKNVNRICTWMWRLQTVMLATFVWLLQTKMQISVRGATRSVQSHLRMDIITVVLGTSISLLIHMLVYPSRKAKTSSNWFWNMKCLIKVHINWCPKQYLWINLLMASHSNLNSIFLAWFYFISFGTTYTTVDTFPVNIPNWTPKSWVTNQDRSNKHQWFF